MRRRPLGPALILPPLSRRSHPADDASQPCGRMLKARHHTYPNVIGKDPDIHTGAIAFDPQAAQRSIPRLCQQQRLALRVGWGLQGFYIGFTRPALWGLTVLTQTISH